MHSKFRLNQGRIVSLPIRFFLTLMVFAVMFWSMTALSESIAIIVCILISLLLPLVWSSYYILEIDCQNQRIGELTWIAGIKRGNYTSYDSIEKIFINQTGSAQRMTSYGGHVHTKRAREYHAYLKTGDSRKFFLLSDSDPVKLEERIQPLVKKLNVNLVKQDNL